MIAAFCTTRLSAISKLVCIILITCFLNSTGAAQATRDTSINIYFKTNSFEVDGDQHRRLNDFLTAFPLIKHITGYADSSGTAAYNFSLSQNRAVAVYAALQNSFDSLDYGILIYKGESVAMPAMWMNRRVQISANLRAPQAIIKDTAANTNTIRAFDLEYIYFVPDKAILTQESVPYIRELATRLQTYKTETFEIVGHVNYQSRFDSSHLHDLYRLSEQRAKAVYDYLLEFGILETKMRYKGVGNAQPVYPLPVNDAQKRKNMRVQIIIKKQ